MQYVLLIYADEAAVDAQQPAAKGAMFQEYGAFVKDLAASGKMKSGDGLQGVSTATTVRVRDGEVQTSSGPFADMTEQLGGYFLIEADSIDEAIAVAARIPTAKLGSVEIRPIRVYR